jgi:D-alanine-D-alanine ligase
MPGMATAVGRVAVAFGGPSPEHDVSVLTALLAARTLRDAGREATLLYWTKNGLWFEVAGAPEARDFAEGVPKGAEPLELVAGVEGGFLRRGRLGAKRPLELDAVIVCCHGGPGEDGSLQGAFDLAGIAYTGPSAASAALGMDKLAQGAVVTAAGLPALPRQMLHGDLGDPGFPGPYIVKPRFGGSSIGIEVVTDLPTALARLKASVHLRRGAILEPYRGDLFDLQIAVRSHPELELSAIERPERHGAGEILDYRDKYVAGAGMHAAARELPARIAPTLEGEIRRVAREAARLLGVRGVARIDFLSDGEQLFVNEINTIPGSLSRHLFIDPQRPFIELLDDLVAEARSRPATSFSADGADGSVLREADSIASKLG